MSRSERAARARVLAREHPACAEYLSFYADLVECQDRLLSRAEPSALGVDGAAVAAQIPELLQWLRRAAPEPLAEAAAALLREHEADWARLVDQYWQSGGRDDSGATDVQLFVVEAALQPFAEAFAAASQGAAASARGCPVCSGPPVVATLREHGQSARRGLVCGLCLTESPAPRLWCPACEETRFDALPVFRADTVPGIRVDACTTCSRYIKTIDLSQNGTAIAVVDDLATLPLDLWARDQGYRRIRPNLLRL